MSQCYKRNYNIELLRILAVFTIVFYHYALTMATLSSNQVLYAEAFAQIAMVSFFGISGFGLFLYFDKEKPSYIKFLRHRFSRLIPHYYFCLIVILLTTGSSFLSSWGLKYILGYVFFVQNLSLAVQSAIDGPLWTVALMAQFYIVAPIIYKCIKTHPIFTSVSAISISILSRILFDTYITHMALDPVYYVVCNIRLLPSTIDIFTFGMTTAYFCTSDLCDKLRKKLYQINSLLALFLFASAWLAIVFIFKQLLQYNNGLWEPAYSSMAWICTWESLLGLIVAGFLIFLFNINLDFSSRLGKIAIILSSSSMLVYYYHMPIIHCSNNCIAVCSYYEKNDYKII